MHELGGAVGSSGVRARRRSRLGSFGQPACLVKSLRTSTFQTLVSFSLITANCQTTSSKTKKISLATTWGQVFIVRAPLGGLPTDGSGSVLKCRGTVARS